MKRIPLVSNTVIYAFLILGSVVMLFPFVWMIISAFKTQSEIVAFPPTFLPNDPTLSNFIEVWNEVDFGRYMLNSVFVLVVKTVIILYTSMLAGYVFSKLTFKGRDAIFLGILATMMVPFPVTMLTLYQQMYWFKWIDSYHALIWTAAFSAFGIFVMRQFMDGIPNDLIEAARIDGAGEFKILHRIVIPLVKPALSALAIFTILAVWNDFLWPFLVLNSDSNYTVPVGLALFRGRYYTEYGIQLAGAVITVIPVIVAFLFLQKQFVKGVVFSGLKE